jgi:hypothetical protein
MTGGKWLKDLEDAAYELAGRRMNPYQRFIDFCTGQRSADIDFGDTDSDDGNLSKVLGEKPLTEANSVSSLILEQWHHLAGWHKPVLDIDMGCLLIDSSTPGHHHLIIDKPMPWSDYSKLLEVLGEVGILEPGYVHASLEREQSWVRTPWTPKPNSKGDNK